jgi:hypothetical protein
MTIAYDLGGRKPCQLMAAKSRSSFISSELQLWQCRIEVRQLGEGFTGGEVKLTLIGQHSEWTTPVRRWWRECRRNRMSRATIKSALESFDNGGSLKRRGVNQHRSRPLPSATGVTNGPITFKLAIGSVSIAESTGLLFSRNPRARTLFYGGFGLVIGAIGR